jgi:ribosome-binding ATPase YchF (GTP1/OBG family)
LYVCNVDENSAVNGNKYVDKKELVKDEDAEVIILQYAEADITELKATKSVVF